MRVPQPIALELPDHGGSVDPQRAGHRVHVPPILLTEFTQALRLTRVMLRGHQDEVAGQQGFSDPGLPGEQDIALEARRRGRKSSRHPAAHQAPH